MKKKDLETWECFKEELDNLNSERDKNLKNSKLAKFSHSSHFLYRGHSDSRWELKTTLDRQMRTPRMSLDEYYQRILAILPRIEEETQRNWRSPELETYKEHLERGRHMLSLFFQDPPGCEYMAYLRHHGFPSPLLDWTASPFIAAFFAFREKSDAEHVSIYAYQKNTQQPRFAGGNRPNIICVSRNIRTHKRHYLQQSRYTLCVEKGNEDFYFAPHEESVQGPEGSQDTVRKYCIPSSEREKVLRFLRRCNINSFSLFGTEESLVETLWSETELEE